MPIIDHNKYFCIGCGGCAFKCPKQCISMTVDNLGQFSPDIDRDACIECKLCEKICPLYNTENIDYGFNYNSIVRNYISCYMGFDDAFRVTSASGGFVTGVLNTLLSQNVIDYAVCLRNKKNENRFYQYEFINKSENLIHCSRSAYYPMEMSQMLRHIKENNGKYAIVVLPCQAKVIRSIQKKDPVLRQRIVFLLGLVCGGMPGAAMVEYLAESVGSNQSYIAQITFREKNGVDLNRNYGITLRNNEGATFRSTFRNGAFGFSFLNKLFHYRGCNICDDIFAEYADAVFMDAWIPEYNSEKMGRSICIIRNEELLKVVKSYFSDNPNCREVTIDVPIDAQNSVGLIQRKKKLAYFKRRFYKRFNYIVPECGEQTYSISEKVKFFIRSFQEFVIQNKSSSDWNKYKAGKIVFSKYDSNIHKFVKRIKRI